MPEPTMTHEPHCNDRCIHYLAGESVSGVAPGVPHREPVGRNSPSQGGVTDSPAPEPIGDTLTYVIGERDGKLTPVLYRQEPLYAPEPGADAAWEDALYSRTRTHGVHNHDGQDCNEYVVGACIARPTPALDVEALDIRWLLDNSNPMHYQGCEPDGCSCGVSAKYEAISDRQAVREELAARATEGGTDR